MDDTNKAPAPFLHAHTYYIITVMQNAFEGQPQGSISSRPTIRRKSSVGLLSSFKAPSGTAVVQVQSLQQQSLNLPMQLPPTPSTSTPPIPGPMSIGRDWDTQSLYSDSTGASATSTINSTAATFQGTSVEYLRDLVQKRIVTLTYMRNTHEG